MVRIAPLVAVPLEELLSFLRIVFEETILDIAVGVDVPIRRHALE